MTFHRFFRLMHALFARRIVGTLLLACCLTSHAAPARITVALEDNYPPYIFLDHEGKPQGIIVDRWKLWEKKTGIPLRIISSDWDKAQALLYAGKADVIDAMFKTPERLKRLDFSQPHAQIDASLFFHKSITGINDINSAKGFVLGVTKGDGNIDWLRSKGVNNMLELRNYETMIQAAQRGDIRLFFSDSPTAIYWLHKYRVDKLFRHTRPLNHGALHWATLKKNRALHKQIEQGFKLISPQEQQEIENRWLGTPVKKAEKSYLIYLAILIAIALGLSVFLLIRNRNLQGKVKASAEKLSATEGELQELANNSKQVFESANMPLAYYHFDGSLIDVNQAFADLIGFSIKDTLDLGNERITPLEYTVQDLKQFRQLKEKGHFGPYEKEFFHKSGQRKHIRLYGMKLNRKGESCAFIRCEDITEFKEIEQHANFLAFHDTLTGLPNRQLAQDRLEQAITHADRDKNTIGLLYLDLDNFKAINDTLGHTIGDQVLVQVARRMTETLRVTDTVSRQGGDEWLIILPRLSKTDDIVRVLVKITDCLNEPFDIDGHEVSTSASVGIAVYPEDGKDLDTLLKNAEIAMYQAKESGRNSYRFFDENMHVGMDSQLNTANGLRRAIERNEFILHYQPQIDLHNGKVIGAEALVRWNQPGNGIVSPGEFIPVAEKSGLIVPIGEWVLHEACRQAAIWHKSGWPDLVIAVNLSAVQFKRPDLEESIMRAINSTGIDPSLLELELTESTLIDNPESVISAVRRLKSLGIKIAIDDFGTGYSSLSYLKQFAVDKLKIDRSFVSDLATDPDDAAIVRAIIQMAHSLGLKTIAEGVETRSIQDRLFLFNCNEAQGYLFAPPMPTEAFTAYLEQRPTDSGQ